MRKVRRLVTPQSFRQSYVSSFIILPSYGTQSATSATISQTYIVQYCRGSGGRSPPVLQGVWGAQPPSIAGGPGGAAPRFRREFGGRRPPILKNCL